MSNPIGIFPNGETHPRSHHRAFEATGEYRVPCHGEYYLCGQPLRGFKFLGENSQVNCPAPRYWIARPVTPPKVRPDYRSPLLALLRRIRTAPLHNNPYEHSEVTNAILALTDGRSKYDLPESNLTTGPCRAGRFTVGTSSQIKLEVTHEGQGNCYDRSYLRGRSQR